MKIEKALPADWPWIRRLAGEVCISSIPPHSRLTPEALRARVRERFRELERAHQAQDSLAAQSNGSHTTCDIVALVAWHQPNGATEASRYGYLILQLHQTDAVTGEAISVIYDLAVAPKYQGSSAVRALVREAAQITHQEGLATMQGDITINNEKAYKQALRLGFQPQRYVIAMDCRR